MDDTILGCVVHVAGWPAQQGKVFVQENTSLNSTVSLRNGTLLFRDVLKLVVIFSCQKQILFQDLIL